MLGEVLDVVLRLLHPVTPFVTEALWTELTRGASAEESLVIAAWPAPDADRRDTAAEAEVAALQELVTEVRRFRSDQGLPPGKRVPARISGLAPSLATHEAEIRALAALEFEGEGFATSSTLTAGSVHVDLDLHGAIDVAAERQRLERDLAAATKDLAAGGGQAGQRAVPGQGPGDRGRDDSRACGQGHLRGGADHRLAQRAADRLRVRFRPGAPASRTAARTAPEAVAAKPHPTLRW